MTLASQDLLVFLVLMVDLVVMDCLELQDPKEPLGPCWLKESGVSLVSQVLQVFQGTGVFLEHLDLDLRDLQERKVSQESQEDLEVLVHPVPKVNQVCQWLRKAYRDQEDWMESQDCRVHQVSQVDLDRMVSLEYQEQRVNLDSQELDFQDLQELKDSQVSPASQDLLQDLADQV